jgi:multiple antibiotic resistance protein
LPSPIAPGQLLFCFPMDRLLPLFKSFALAFGALLPVVNPLGSALVLLGIVGNAPASVFRSLARRIAINMTLFMVVVELLGAGLLNFFGISLPVVQVAGGLVLASMGWRLLNQPATATKTDADVKEVSFGSIEQKVFYPLTFPVTIGPGCIVVMLTLSADASAQGHRLENVIAHLGIFLAVAALSASIYLSYRYAPKITERVSHGTANGILRIVAFVLLCIGVQITAIGLGTLLKGLLKS